jgi:hypothetical protein
MIHTAARYPRRPSAEGCAIRRAKTAMALLWRAAGSFGGQILHGDQPIGEGALDALLLLGGLLGP